MGKNKYRNRTITFVINHHAKASGSGNFDYLTDSPLGKDFREVDDESGETKDHDEDED